MEAEESLSSWPLVSGNKSYTRSNFNTTPSQLSLLLLLLFVSKQMFYLDISRISCCCSFTPLLICSQKYTPHILFMPNSHLLLALPEMQPSLISLCFLHPIILVAFSHSDAQVSRVPVPKLLGRKQNTVFKSSKNPNVAGAWPCRGLHRMN